MQWPAAYQPDYSATLRKVSSPTIGLRFEHKEKGSGAQYVALPSTLHGPKYSIGLRESCDISLV